MIIFDNIIFSLQKAGGISVVWKNLLENIIPQTENIRFIDYADSHNNLFRKDIDIDNSKILNTGKFNKVLSQFLHPRIESEDKFIFHSSYFRYCNNPKAINVTTVHDFIYEQGKPTLKQELRIWLIYKTIRKSDAIVCISENTKKDLFKYLPDTALEKVHVIYNGVAEDYRPLETTPYPQYKNSVLFVGGRQGYKNFDFVVRSLHPTSYNLIICGSPLTLNEKILCDKYLPNRYTNVPFPNNEELNRIYNSVYCLVYPSSYEGFGIPILEAQRAECPVIALKSSSIPEVIGEDGIMLSALSEDELRDKLNSLENHEYRKHIIESGLKNSKKFSWQKMASEYMELYNILLQNSLK